MDLRPTPGFVRSGLNYLAEKHIWTNRIGGHFACNKAACHS